MVDPQPIIHTFIERITPNLTVGNDTIFSYFSVDNPECYLMKVELVQDKLDNLLNSTRAELIKIDPLSGNLTVVTTSRLNETITVYMRGTTFGNKKAYQPLIIDYQAPYNGPPKFPSTLAPISLTINQDDQPGLPIFKYISPKATDKEGDKIFMNFTATQNWVQIA